MKTTDPTDLTYSPSVMATTSWRPPLSMAPPDLDKCVFEGALTLLIGLNARARFFLILLNLRGAGD